MDGYCKYAFLTQSSKNELPFSRGESAAFKDDNKSGTGPILYHVNPGYKNRRVAGNFHQHGTLGVSAHSNRFTLTFGSQTAPRQSSSYNSINHRDINFSPAGNAERVDFTRPSRSSLGFRASIVEKYSTERDILCSIRALIGNSLIARLNSSSVWCFN